MEEIISNMNFMLGSAKQQKKTSAGKCNVSQWYNIPHACNWRDFFRYTHIS